MKEINNNHDLKFLNHIMSEICDYAIDNNMNVNETLKTISKNILNLLEFCDFNQWEPKKRRITQ